MRVFHFDRRRKIGIPFEVAVTCMYARPRWSPKKSRRSNITRVISPRGLFFFDSSWSLIASAQRATGHSETHPHSTKQQDSRRRRGARAVSGMGAARWATCCVVIPSCVFPGVRYLVQQPLPPTFTLRYSRATLLL